MCNTQKLLLNGNKIGDAGMIKFSEALVGGALPSLWHLDLESNTIGDVGLSALASACASGALPQLEDLWLGQDAPALEAACEARGITYD